MSNLQADIREYTDQLDKGQIQRAYKGIMTFMSGLCAELEAKYPYCSASALYFGYMDMTYFAFTPPDLKRRKLKIAVVYLHEEFRFEVWLGGGNRKIQADYIELLSRKNTGEYKLSKVAPGVDSIIEHTLVEQPDFNSVDILKGQIEEKLMGFIRDLSLLLDE